MKKEDYKIGEDLVGIRLDKAISLKDKDISRMAVQRLIDEENILVNGKKAKSSYKLNFKWYSYNYKTWSKRDRNKTWKYSFRCCLWR